MATAEEIQSQWNTYSPQRMEDVYRQMWQGDSGYRQTNKTKSGSKDQSRSSDSGEGK